MGYVEHSEVYRRPGRYAGWPANYGIWSWEDEIVVGFTAGYMDVSNPGMHAIDKKRGSSTMLARSIDGGKTWAVEEANISEPGGMGVSANEHMSQSGLSVPSVRSTLEKPPGDIQFEHSDFAMMCARDGLGEGACSWFYVSYDRCHSWAGPYGLPDFGTHGVAARTDYHVTGPNECSLFLTGKINEYEGVPFCATTTDAGKTFTLRSYVGPEPDGFSIMPAGARLPGGDWLVAVRRRSERPPAECAPNWIEMYRSTDDCLTWKYSGVLTPDTGDGGNPPTLHVCGDGILCAVYGYRDPPFGIRARISRDMGVTWEPEMILRSDGGCRDIGYPRTAVCPDGTLVSVYYYADSPGGERYIAATRWRP